MTTKKKTAAKKVATASTVESPADREDSANVDTTSATGARLIDGRPYFGDHDGQPMNRVQYLDATADERKAALIAALTADEPEDIYALHGDDSK